MERERKGRFGVEGRERGRVGLEWRGERGREGLEGSEVEW